MINIDLRLTDDAWEVSVVACITATESPQVAIMPSIARTLAVDPSLYSMNELIELRRNILRYARSCPPGPERNHRRQIALSLRALFKNEKWLRSHT